MSETTLETGLEGIAYCCLPVADIFQTAEWYVKHFGFEIKFPRGDSRLSLWNNGRPILDLVKKDADTTATFTLNGKPHWIVTFRTKNIEALYSKLQAEGVSVRPSISDEGEWGKFFTFTDPDGNFFDVWEHPDCPI